MEPSSIVGVASLVPGVAACTGSGRGTQVRDQPEVTCGRGFSEVSVLVSTQRKHGKWGGGGGGGDV